MRIVVKLFSALLLATLSQATCDTYSCALVELSKNRGVGQICVFPEKQVTGEYIYWLDPCGMFPCLTLQPSTTLTAL